MNVELWHIVTGGLGGAFAILKRKQIWVLIGKILTINSEKRKEAIEVLKDELDRCRKKNDQLERKNEKLHRDKRKLEKFIPDEDK